MSVWFINGTIFTGNVVTVGSGKDYTTLMAAQNAMSSDTLFLIDPGSYLQTTVRYNSYFRGMGTGYEDVVISTISQNDSFDIVYEWLTINNYVGAGSPGNYAGMLTLSKVDVKNAGGCVAPWTAIADKVRRNFRYTRASGVNMQYHHSVGSYNAAKYLWGALGTHPNLAEWNISLSSVTKCVGKPLYGITSTGYPWLDYDFTFGGKTNGTELVQEDYITSGAIVSGGMPAFSGDVVLVGPGRHFATIQGAISGTTGDILIYLDAGTYNNVYLEVTTENRSVYVKAVDANPQNTVLTVGYSHFVYLNANGARVFIEGVKIHCGAGSSEVVDVPDAITTGTMAVFNKCIILQSACSGATLLSWHDTTSIIKLIQCKLTIITPFGNPAYIFTGLHATWNISACAIDKCEFDMGGITNGWGMSYNTSGSLAVNDYALSPFTGYGPEFGESFINVIMGYGPEYGSFLITAGRVPPAMDYYKQIRGLY